MVWFNIFRSGTEEEYSELQQLLEDVNTSIRDMRELKEMKAKGKERIKEKEKEKVEKGLAMRQAALSGMTSKLCNYYKGDNYQKEYYRLFVLNEILKFIMCCLILERKHNVDCSGVSTSLINSDDDYDEDGDEETSGERKSVVKGKTK